MIVIFRDIKPYFEFDIKNLDFYVAIKMYFKFSVHLKKTKPSTEVFQLNNGSGIQMQHINLLS